MTASYDDNGVRFSHPSDWELEVTDDGPRATITLQSPGPAFAFVSIDETCPDPAEEADAAGEAMKDEYPGADASPASEKIAGYDAVGYDLEFFSLDVVVLCAIRCFRAANRTVLVFGQWSEIEDEESESAIRVLRGSLEVTDAVD
jgi:hypothetical protein